MNTEYDLDSERIQSVAMGHWDQVLYDLAPTLAPALERPGKHVACPVHGGQDGFRVYPNVHEHGGGICNTCTNRAGGHGWANGIALLMWVNDWDYRKTLEAIATYYGLEFTPRGTRIAPRPSKPQYYGNPKTIQLTWDHAVSLDHPSAEPARLYFASRGIELDWSEFSDVRFHPKMKYYHRDPASSLAEGEDSDLPAYVGSYPAIITLLRGADLKPVTLQRLYLNPNGTKADVPGRVKKMMGVPEGRSYMGGGVYLYDTPHDTIGVAEGIETALSVVTAIGLPMVSTLSTTVMAAFQPPETVQRVIVYEDKDRPKANGKSPGHDAALQLQRRLEGQGIEVIIMTPPLELSDTAKSVDWNDVLQQSPGASFQYEGNNIIPINQVKSIA